MEKIIALTQEYGQEEIEWTMNRANEFGNYGYSALKRILIKYHEDPDSLPQTVHVPTPIDLPLVNVDVEVRDLTYYAKKGGDPSWRNSSTA
jgi:hypothetical protein